MKRLFFLLIILSLGSFGSIAQEKNILDTMRVYRITSCYYKTPDSTYNLTEFFREGVITEYNISSSILLTIEEEWEKILTMGAMRPIEKPDFALVEEVDYYEYDFSSKLFYSDEPAVFFKEIIEDSYETRGFWFYFWWFRFDDQTELQIYAYDSVSEGEEPPTPLKLNLPDKSSADQ